MTYFIILLKDWPLHKAIIIIFSIKNQSVIKIVLTGAEKLKRRNLFMIRKIHEKTHL
jgi:hypothetical protein